MSVFESEMLKGSPDVEMSVRDDSRLLAQWIQLELKVYVSSGGKSFSLNKICNSTVKIYITFFP